jgi:hypothetical protein
MFLEAAFSICVGCILYKMIMREKPEHCPGGVCEIKQKEPIQMFNPVQKIITSITAIALILGVYFFLVKTESKTFFGLFLHDLVLSEKQLQVEKELLFEKQAAKEFDDDDDF